MRNSRLAGALGQIAVRAGKRLIWIVIHAAVVGLAIVGQLALALLPVDGEYRALLEQCGWAAATLTLVALVARNLWSWTSDVWSEALWRWRVHPDKLSALRVPYRYR